MKLSARLYAFGAVLFCFFLTGCSLCGNEIKQTAISPDGELKAVVFERDCGATTCASTQISILDAENPLPNEAGNLFIAQCDDPAEVKWLGNRRLAIKHTPPDSNSKKPTAEKQIDIPIGLVSHETITVVYAP